MLKRTLSWLLQGGKSLWPYSIAISAFFFAMSLSPVPEADTIKIYGLLLQLVGAGIILKSLHQRSILFNGKNLVQIIIEYVRACPIFRRKKTYTVDAEAGAFATSTSTGNISAKKTLRTFEDVHQFIAEIEDRLNQRINEERAHTQKRFEQVNSDLYLLFESHKEKTAHLENFIRKSVGSNISIEAFGVLCVIFGLVLSTIPEYISALYRTL